MRAAYRAVSIAAFAVGMVPLRAMANDPGALPEGSVDLDNPPPPRAPAPPAPAIAPSPASLRSSADAPAVAGGWSWYGWQIVLSDASAVAALALGETVAIDDRNNSASGDALFALGASQYLFGGFAVHAAHRRWVNAAVSIGRRVLAPAVGLLIGVGMAQADGGFQGLSDIGYGFLGGVVLAHLIDATALSFVAPGRRDARDAPAPATSRGAVQWAPLFHVAPERRGGTVATFGIGATF